MGSEFHVCHTCAVGLVNDDWSSVDCENTYTLILAWLKTVSYLIHVREEDKGGRHYCECCGKKYTGTAHIFQPIV